MAPTPHRLSALLVAIGGGALIVSLFGPWYEVVAGGAMPQRLRDTYFLVFAQVEREPSGWQALSSIDLWLFAGGLVAVAVGAASLAWRIAWPLLLAVPAGAVSALLVAYRLIDRPDVDTSELRGRLRPVREALDLSLDPRAGIFVALAGSLAMVAGGLRARRAMRASRLARG